MELWDFIFPKRCIGCRKFGSYLCAACFSSVSFTTHSICVVCNRNTLDGLTHPGCLSRFSIDGVFASIVYKGIVKRLLYKYKYSPYLSDLTNLLGELLYEGIIQNEVAYIIFARKPLLIPIPLHISKLRSRGYNQAALLAQDLAKRMNVSTCPILIRQTKTTSQTSLPRVDRLQNVKGIFSMVEKHQELLKKREVILIDDVFTTGATFHEAAKVLKHAGVEKVWGIALAHEE